MKHLSNEIKSLLTLIAGLTIIPNIIIAFNKAGTERVISVSLIICALLLIFRWRRFVNYIRNTESIHQVVLENNVGDASYFRSISLLPYLWSINTSEVFISCSGKNSKIEWVKANCPVIWKKKENTFWEGIVKPKKHKPLLFSFKEPPGTRITLVKSISGATT